MSDIRVPIHPAHATKPHQGELALRDPVAFVGSERRAASNSRLIPLTDLARLDAEPQAPQGQAAIRHLPLSASLLVERRYRHKDGTSLAAEVGFSQLPDGRLQRNIRDISERLASEAERTRLVSAVEQTADSIWMNDLDGTITYVNPAFTRAYGYEPAEIVGQYAGILDSGSQDPVFLARSGTPSEPGARGRGRSSAAARTARRSR